MVLTDTTGERSPAARSGLRRGDIITQVDDVPVTQGGDLRRTLRDRAPGNEVTLSVVRESERVRVRVRLAEAPGT
ncbi:MAG: PDZ domain-containing protein [Gemmatimonadales bacterium]|nr:PDZ domain-containing protein [Gemmatimonadales bacterium]